MFVYVELLEKKNGRGRPASKVKRVKSYKNLEPALNFVSDYLDKLKEEKTYFSCVFISEFPEVEQAKKDECRLEYSFVR